MKDLQEVRDILSSIPCINSGGCGFSALFMYLSTGQSERYSIYSGHNRHGRSLDGINENSNIIACPHVFLYDSEEREFFDCDEDNIDITRFDVLEQIDLFKLVSIIKGPGWNAMFDRVHVPEIESRTGISLEEFDFECCRKKGLFERAANFCGIF